MMTTNSKILVPALALACCLVSGCNRSNAKTRNASESSTSVVDASSASGSATKVTRIVFVGKEHPCDCTRKAIEAGWAALQQALGIPAKLPVERLQVDTEASKVEPYRSQKPIMALPAMYFLDGKSTVVEILQGEVTAEQVAGVLQAKRSAPRGDR